jgi:hypothetical protein
MKVKLIFKNGKSQDGCKKNPTATTLYKDLEEVKVVFTNAPDCLASGDTVFLGLFAKYELGELQGRSHWDAPSQTRVMVCRVSDEQFQKLKGVARPDPVRNQDLDEPVFYVLPNQEWK